ncbi:hypothetical protein DPMN_187047 [Dreissena polymorpha]|uniref:Alpha-2-macroglobulin bait region domain-containing protein n=1 Tax=Dreissena polymorpha TaxID=45954 RepID=A0A9D4DPS7_DREPO|nr:hypothetical protein DPMN_187047 [Dreissena polymorpha]
MKTGNISEPDRGRSVTMARQQVDMLYPNGTPAKLEDFILEVYNGGQLASNTSHTTNEKGQCVYLIAPVFEDMDRMLKLYVRGFEEFAIEFQLKHDSRKKPLIVEQVQEGDASFKVTNTDFRQVHRMSGIIILVLSRGKIVEKIYSNAQKSVVRRLDQTVITKTFPRGRGIAFYVDNWTNEVFVDSSTFTVDSACNGHKLELVPERLIVQPGSVSKLTVNHHTGMSIGLNVFDKVLLLLNKENILKADKIKQEMESHDLGCGVGDGETSEDIFTNAGLTFLTNANVNATRIIEETKECADKKRARHYVYNTRGVSPSNEVCLIETRNEVKAFKEFFIQVNVPYKVLET